MSDSAAAADAPKATADPARVKALRIKTGVVKRTGKEKLSYRKEADAQKDKVEKMKADGKDEADVKKMNEESLMMIPECHRRLEKSLGELRALMEADRAELGETEEFAEAVKVADLAEEQLKAN